MCTCIFKKLQKSRLHYELSIVICLDFESKNSFLEDAILENSETKFIFDSLHRQIGHNLSLLQLAVKLRFT